MNVETNQIRHRNLIMERARILIVEDEAIIAMELESQLQSLGYEVTSVVNTGEKAIEKAEADKPDLILMDIRIKGDMDGIDTAEVIRNRFDIPVIFSTAYLDQERIQRAKITMPFGYVLKPIQERDLKVTLEMALYVAKVDNERKTIQEELKKNEQKYRGIFDESIAAIYLFDEKKNILDSNQAGLDLLGYSREELLTMKISDTDTDSVVVSSAHEQLLSNEKIINYEHQLKRKDGGIITVLNNSRPIEDSQGNVVGMQSTLIEISDRKQAEEALQQSEEKYRSILETMEEGYFEVDLAGTFTLTNESMAKILGYSNNELLGVNNRSFMDQSTAAKVYMIFNSIYKSRNPQKYFNYEINRKDGQKRTVEVSTALRLNNEGIPCGFSGVARDVTEQKKSRELMIQTEKVMSLGGLAAGMAHELNNPLGGILQGVQNIQRRLSTDLKSNLEISEQTGIDLQNLQLYLEKRGILSMLSGIQDSGRKASQIISNILQFSRRSESQMAPTDLTKLVENVLDLSDKDYNLGKEFDFRNIRIKKEFDSNQPLIPCIETEIEQVILNLLNNAAWAMSNDEDNGSPQITLRIKLENKAARIEVEDNGPGMDEETSKQIFEPFFTTKPVGEGTGLGLSVSYMIITNNHRGKMAVESEIGKGSKFIIQLPLEKELAS